MDAFIQRWMKGIQELAIRRTVWLAIKKGQMTKKERKKAHNRCSAVRDDDDHWHPTAPPVHDEMMMMRLNHQIICCHLHPRPCKSKSKRISIKRNCNAMQCEACEIVHSSWHHGAQRSSMVFIIWMTGRSSARSTLSPGPAQPSPAQQHPIHADD